MALTGKTIGQLTYVDYTTNNFLIPIEESGTTYHIGLSAITYTETTYLGLSIASAAEQLIRGQYYLMTDFQTCYDQPNYDSTGNPITTGNYKTGTTEPILLLATSTTGFSPTVYSTLYPQDKISYDFTWNTTEVTGGPAKGRITERIDERNNRADYDFRAVQFIRYDGWFSERYYEGKVSVVSSTGLVTGTTTNFTNDFSVGQVIGIYHPNGGAPISCFMYYEITTIASDTEMYVTGRVIYDISNTYYSNGVSLANYMNPFQNNITGGTNDNSAEYYTFNSGSNYNTYLGNNSNYSTFLLSNNVFLSGNYYDNTFGGNVVGNTFNDDMDSNTIGPFCQYNIITNDFDKNTIGPYFQYNVIDCDMDFNEIGPFFRYNMLGDDDAQDFDRNRIGSYFEYNFFTFSNGDFYNNNIGTNFARNIIDSLFTNNTIVGGFYDNVIVIRDFNNNQIGQTFNNNFIPSDFTNNNLTGNFYSNNIYSRFDENVFGENVNANTFGSPNNFNFYSFTNNNIGGDFATNYFSGDTQYNTIGWGASGNNVDTNFSYNQIGTLFYANTIANDFGFGGGSYRGNIIGNSFNTNTVGEYCYNNTFGDECNSNNLSNNFINNRVSYGFNNVTISNLDAPGSFFQNNNFTYGYFSTNLTLTGGTGGNPVFYSSIPTTVTLDYVDASGYVTFLSGGTYVTQNIIVVPVSPTPTPTNTPSETPTNTPTSTPTGTPAVTPTNTATNTPTPSPVWLFIIESTNSTRSVTDANIAGVTQTLNIGSYPVLNSTAFAATHGTADGSSTFLQFTFGGSGFFNTLQVFKNGVLTFDQPGYAAGSIVCGGLSIASNDVIKLVVS